MATTPEFPAAVAQTVEAAIRAAGKTTSSVADETGIPAKTLERLIKNQNIARSFQVRELGLIAKALGLDPVDLIPTQAVA